jgi:hypothetical protein
MRLAVVSFLLLFAGIGLALGDAGSCICPNSISCSQEGCVANCGGTCAETASITSPALNTTEAAPCGAQYPNGGCGSAGGCQACCGTNCTSCCGGSADSKAVATSGDSGAPTTPACGSNCVNTGRKAMNCGQSCSGSCSGTRCKA